jgi:hypothetical protein
MCVISQVLAPTHFPSLVRILSKRSKRNFLPGVLEPSRKRRRILHWREPISLDASLARREAA